MNLLKRSKSDLEKHRELVLASLKSLPHACLDLFLVVFESFGLASEKQFVAQTIKTCQPRLDHSSWGTSYTGGGGCPPHWRT